MVLALILLVKFTPSVLKSNQGQNLEAIRSHISETQSQWQQFQRQNAGFEGVHFFGYTGGEGMFGAYGEVPSAGHVLELRKFMESTLPPRPVYMGAIQVRGPEMTALKKENNSAPAATTTETRTTPIETRRKTTAPASRR